MSTKEYFRKPYMTQGITKHSDYMKAVPQKAIDVQGQIAPNIEFKKPYDFTPNTAQMIHYYSNQLHYMGGDPVPPLNDPSLLPHAPVLEVPVEESGEIAVTPLSNGDDCQWNASFFYDGVAPNFAISYDQNGSPASTYVRFPNIKIPKEATITHAMIAFYAKLNTATSPVTTKIYANNADSTVAPTSVATGEALLKTNASIDWNATENWAVNSVHYTPEIKSVLQEIVNRSGWSKGNALGILIIENGGGNYPHYPYCFNDGSAAYYPKLIATFT